MNAEMKLLGILGGKDAFRQVFSVFATDGISPTLTTAAAHSRPAWIMVDENDNKSLCNSKKGIKKNDE